MSRIYVCLLFVCVIVLTACSGSAQAPAAQSPGAPVATRTLVPVPAQPTSLPLATRPVTPFASATFAPVLTAPSSGASAPPAAPTAASAQPAATQAPAGPSAPGVATGVRSEIKVEFVQSLETAESVDDLRLTLKQIAGILDVAGNETSVVIGYDAGLILPNQIRARLASIGHPVKP